MTPLRKIYTAFLSKMSEDDWLDWTEEEAQADWMTLLEAAISWFKFPKNSLVINEEENSFEGDLDTREIQILSTYMKCEWLNRKILAYENIEPLYDERDYSPANFINRLSNLLERERKHAKDLESIYYRVVNNIPFDYKRLAGDIE